jgi:hypothetical protein
MEGNGKKRSFTNLRPYRNVFLDDLRRPTKKAPFDVQADIRTLHLRNTVLESIFLEYCCCF